MQNLRAHNIPCFGARVSVTYQTNRGSEVVTRPQIKASGFSGLSKYANEILRFRRWEVKCWVRIRNIDTRRQG